MPFITLVHLSRALSNVCGLLCKVDLVSGKSTDFERKGRNNLAPVTVELHKILSWSARFYVDFSVIRIEARVLKAQKENTC